MSKSTIKNALNIIKSINGYWKVGAKIDEELNKVYFDEDNLCYNDVSLIEPNLILAVNKFKEKNFRRENPRILELGLSEKVR